MPFEKFQSVVKILIFLEQLERKKKKDDSVSEVSFFSLDDSNELEQFAIALFVFLSFFVVGRDRNFLILRNCVNRKFRNRKA